jgi:dolichyl-phosphate beta-glucosyltransferase
VPTKTAALGSLSVVIPAFNACATLPATVAHVHAWLASVELPHEIIVVDDGSTDDTARVARSLGPHVRVISYAPNRGKGHAVRTGMLAATSEWALFMDADNSTTIDHLERFAAALDAPRRPDVVIASRRLRDSRIVRPQHPVRQALGRTFPYVVRAIALPHIADTQCGFKLFSTAAARDIFSRLRTERFAFDVEALLLARHLGYGTVEVGVDWDNPTTSTVQIHRDTFRMLWDLIWMTARVRLAPAPKRASEPSESRTRPD